MVYFLCLLDAIRPDCLPNFCLENEETLLKTGGGGPLTPKYFTYEQRVKFVIGVFQQSMALVECDSGNYRRLMGHYLDFIIQHVHRLGAEQARKLFKQILKKPSNCGEINYWKQFVQLELQLNELTSAKRIYRQMLVMLINQQSSEQQESSQQSNQQSSRQADQRTNQQADQQFLRRTPASEISDFIEFELRINGVKQQTILVSNCLKPGDFEREKEMGEEILIFAYSILNSRAFDAAQQIGPTIQLRTIRKIEQLLADCFGQVAGADVHSAASDNGAPSDTAEDREKQNNLISLIVLKAYDCFFRRLLPGQPAEQPAAVLERASGVFDEAVWKIENALQCEHHIESLIERIHERQLDLHLLFLKFNFGNLRSFNRLLRRAIERHPKNRNLLALLVNTQNSFRCTNDQIEKWVNSLLTKLIYLSESDSLPKIERDQNFLTKNL